MSNQTLTAGEKRPRLHLGSKKGLEYPHLIRLHLKSYRDELLQLGVKPSDFQDIGLHHVLNESFPISSNSAQIQLQYESYTIGEPSFHEHECKVRGETYAAPLRAKLRSVYFDKEVGKFQKILEAKEQDVYIGEIPLMTETGSFIINGTEKVVVSQLYRSPGVSIEHDRGKTHSSGKLLYSARIIPYRGAWIDIEFDAKDIISVRIDRRKKLPVTVLLKAMGYDSQMIIDHFYEREKYTVVEGKLVFDLVPERLKGQIASHDMMDTDGNVLIEKGTRIWLKEMSLLKKSKVKEVLVDASYIVGKVTVEPIIDKESGEILVDVNTALTEDILEKILEAGIDALSVIYVNDLECGSYISDTLMTDHTKSQMDAWVEIYHMLRPGEPPTSDAAKNLFESLFYDPSRYDLSHIGRMKINERFKKDKPETHGVLDPDDVLEVVKALVDTRDGQHGHIVDDIDNLSNRRVRCVGEMVANQFRVAMVKVVRSTLDRMVQADVEGKLPQDFFNAKPVVSAWRELFTSSQLSQYMERGNPLSLVTHLRRISALGQGGLDRARATIDVRDVHPSHYGRICPIETPEGQNIGLINSLSVYSDLNKYGFMVTPFFKVENGVVTKELCYLSSYDEYDAYIAQATIDVDKQGVITADVVECRYNGEYTTAKPNQLKYIEVAANQLVSVAASLIPFLEHDDANRALMGSNMQRQAVPMIVSDKPLVGTGMERKVASDSGVSMVAKRAGTVVSVDSSRIVVKVDDASDEEGVGVDIYRTTKFFRSNQNTCINQRPIVSLGDTVKVGDIITDGAGTDLGELALGQNMLVAFMSWNGYNFEDSIILSERVAEQDRFTSIHIHELQCIARDTKLGPEEITADIPNIGEGALGKLDESGVAYIGAKVESGDILVGKVTPKGESQLTPEEKLLRAIFGEKASDVKDSSLRVPAGTTGTVVDVKVFTRDGTKKDARALAIAEEELESTRKDLSDELKLKSQVIYDDVKTLLLDKQYKEGIKGIKSGIKMTDTWLLGTKDIDLLKVVTGNAAVDEKLAVFVDRFKVLEEDFEKNLEKRRAQIQTGDELTPGVIKVIKVFLATTKRIQPGDKMAGRHGNKGVISTIVPVEDMPYLADGTAIDVILNPLGVPSRMNVGQILEMHLGLAAKGLGKQIQKMLKEHKKDIKPIRDYLTKIYKVSKVEDTDLSYYSDQQIVELAVRLSDGVPMNSPVFDGASIEKIKELLEMAGQSKSGQEQLYDGRTGLAFDKPSTVGYMYILKLNHLVDDKMHARSTGSYSLVTQQPLSGKAQNGGQRFGEMEVWALEAYGAAYTLQEMLTVKSDDVAGRTKMYKNIVDGNYKMQASIPESFNVLTKEIMALGINVTLNEQ